MRRHTRVLPGIAAVALTMQVLAAPQTPQAPAAPARAASPFVPPEPLDYGDRTGWTSIFDGATLAGWDGNPEVWSVRDGAITAVSTAERRLGSTHLIWRGEELADFEWKLEIKLEGDIHSGVAYRSAIAPPPTGAPPTGAGRGATLHVPANPKWTLLGPGLDYDYDRTMAGNVEDRGTPRREVAWRGLIVRAEPGQRPRTIGSVGDEAALKETVKVDDWNQIHIIARGHQLTHIMNGHVMTILFDDDPTYFRAKGFLGLQIEQWGLGRVSARNLYIKRL